MRKTTLLAMVAGLILAGLPSPSLAIPFPSTPISPAPPVGATNGEMEFDLLSADEGWLLAGQRLHWTHTGGRSWEDVTPPGLGETAIGAVTFLDARQGWLVVVGADETGFPAYTLAHTADGGDTWQVAPLALFVPGKVDAYAAAVYLRFLDAQTGWLVVKQATSSNFSVGALFRTTDGGATWTRLSIPIGAPVVFVTPEVGWTAGGPAGDQLYRTQDGGKTWTAQTTGGSGPQRYYQLPTFQNVQEGVLPVVVNDGEQALVELYTTQDGGESWALETNAPLGQEVAPGVRVPLAVFDATRWLLFAPDGGRIGSGDTPDESGRPSRQDPLAAGIVELDMATPGVGWARYESGNCAAGQCTMETRLLRTGDGGQTWVALALPGGAEASVSSAPAPPPAASVHSPSGRTQAFIGHGFDKCEVATLGQAQTWINSSPYRVMNLYIGGSTRSCRNAALNAALVSQLSQQNWKFIPTWVGPQSTCWPHATSSRISNDPPTAHNQGVSEANAAVEVAASLGLTLGDKSGSIIYYDLENYNTGDATCREAAKSFISGWVSQLRVRGNLAGVYSNGPPLTTFASISNVPDAIWAANWYYGFGDPRGVYNPNATVWNVYGLSNDLWNNHQRIRQYTGGHNETWGGIMLDIDCDVLDGVVANLSSDGGPPVTTHILAGTVGAGGWYISGVQVTLSASDGGGSGVKLIQYRVDGGPWQTYGSPFTVSGDGAHTVFYQAQDNAGNWESEKQASFKTDIQAPANPTAVSPGCAAANNVWQNACNDLAFTWSGASDGAGSGVRDYHRYWGKLADGAPDVYTPDAAYAPPAVPGPVAVRHLRVSTRDLVGHESQPATLFVLRYDASAPTVTVEINGDAATTNQTNVLLALSAGDTGSSVSEVRVSNNNLDWSPWQSYADTIAWTLPALDRQSLTVYVQVRDRAGNISAVANDSIYLDLYPPMPHSANYRICQDVVDAGGSVGLTSTGYHLSSAIGQPWATGGETGFLGKDPLSSGFLASITGCLPISHAVTTNYTVTQWVVASGGNLRGSASYRLGDTAGQPAASGGTAFTSAHYALSSGFWAQSTGTLPITSTPPISVPTRTPTPTPTPSPTPTPQPGDFGIRINDGSPYTNDPLVTVRAWAPNVTHLRLSNDGGYSDEGWQTYHVTTTWVITTYGSYLTPRTVYAWFRDAGGTVYGPYADRITYDPVAPEGRVSLLGGATVTVTLWLEAWDDNSGVADVRIREAPAMALAAWQPFAQTVEWVLTGNVVYVQFRDRAGNESWIYGSDGRTYDPNAKHIYLPLVIRGG